MCRRVVGEAECTRPITPQRTRQEKPTIMMMENLSHVVRASPERGGALLGDQGVSP